jgi:hypothetical protein
MHVASGTSLVSQVSWHSAWQLFGSHMQAKSAKNFAAEALGATPASFPGMAHPHCAGGGAGQPAKSMTWPQV